MVKGWRVGEGKVIGGGEADDMGKRGSRSFARANFVWFVVGVDVPPIVGRGWEGMASSAVGVDVPPIVGRGWEGMASSAGLGARGTLRRPGRRRGRLRRRAV